MTIVAQHNQSLFDLAIQFLGTAQAVFDFANANNLSITDQLTPGQEITIPESSIYENKDIANYYLKNGIVPVTGSEPDGISTNEPLEGIGAMIIESTFIVQ